MVLKINKWYIGAEEKNELYKRGFRYIVKGDYKTLDSIDPWSGMPNTTNNIYAFTDKAEAEAFAVTQAWVFNPDVHSSVEELPEHTKTWTEVLDEANKKEAEQKIKREAIEAKKAAEVGMTVEEYRAEHDRITHAKELENEITELEDELARKKALLKKLED